MRGFSLFGYCDKKHAERPHVLLEEAGGDHTIQAIRFIEKAVYSPIGFEDYRRQLVKATDYTVDYGRVGAITIRPIMVVNF